MELKGKRAFFLGDSITYGYSLNSQEESYHQVLKREKGLLTAVNYGVNGSRIARQSVVDDMGPCFAERYLEMDDNADIIVVFGGTNDHAHGDAPIGTFADRTDETFYGAMHTLILGLKKKYPDAFILFMTPLHRIEENKPNAATGKLLVDYVNIIKEVTAFYNIPVLDLYECCSIQPNDAEQRERLCPDGIHPNARGHKMISDCMIQFFNKN